jgi:hypothetical protein
MYDGLAGLRIADAVEFFGILDTETVMDVPMSDDIAALDPRYHMPASASKTIAASLPRLHCIGARGVATGVLVRVVLGWWHVCAT